MPVSAVQRELVSLFPRFLGSRRRMWAGLSPIVESSGLERPAFFVLMALVQETTPGEALSQQEMVERLYNPYATLHPFLAVLPACQEAGYLALMDDRYIVTPAGRALIERTEQAAREYLATLVPLPELSWLAINLEECAKRLWRADEPAVKAHQARAQRLPPITTDAPMVHLEAAIFALWMARDDAHIAAWKSEGFTGPEVDVLSYLWTHDAQSLAELSAAFQQTQRPEDVRQAVTALQEAGYASVEEERIGLTDAGRGVRNRIEEETDRVYFASWPALTSQEMERLCRALLTVCETLVAS